MNTGSWILVGATAERGLYLRNNLGKIKIWCAHSYISVIVADYSSIVAIISY